MAKCNFYVLGKITIPGLQTKIAKINSINDQAQKFANNSEAIAFITTTNPFLTNQAGLIKFNNDRKAFIIIQNCAPFDISIPRKKKLGFLELNKPRRN